MLHSERQYQRAAKEVERLERLVTGGAATDEDRARYWAGVEELLCWEWAEEGRAMRTQPEPERAA